MISAPLPRLVPELLEFNKPRLFINRGLAVTLTINNKILDFKEKT